MIVLVGIFLALEHRSGLGRRLGVTMSTDTAFALGLLALVARGLPDRVRSSCSQWWSWMISWPSW